MGAAPKPKIFIQKRRGKTVTIISGLHTYGSKKLEIIAKELKTSLGSGGTIKNGTIVIQGDKHAQINKWFFARKK